MDTKLTPLNVDKVDSVRSQIDAAIYILFTLCDSIPVLTLGYAAHKILTDLSKNNRVARDHLDNLAKESMPWNPDEFWKFFRAPGNFLKHADKDPKSRLDRVKEEAGELIISECCCLYVLLGHKPTANMRIFSLWYAMKYPETVPSHIELPTGFHGGTESWTRQDWLNLGRSCLEGGKGKSRATH